MKIIIFGVTGMLGNYVFKYLNQTYDCIGITRNDFDINNLSNKNLDILFKQKEFNSGDIVVNCAGLIPQTDKEKSNRIYYKVNAIFPILLGNKCRENNIKMIHITTDCVFNGSKGGYDENSPSDVTDDYGVSKSLGDLCYSTIIRSSIIGEEIYNKRSLLEWVKSNVGKEINGFNNFYWNGITCLQMAKLIEEIIIRNDFWEGVRHFYSPRSISKYELLLLINEKYDLNIKINSVKFKDETKDMTISSIYNNYVIPDLEVQIEELRKFSNRVLPSLE
jgi:dTDP-4-dehydrorhamnose reductase